MFILSWQLSKIVKIRLWDKTKSQKTICALSKTENRFPIVFLTGSNRVYLD